MNDMPVNKEQDMAASLKERGREKLMAWIEIQNEALAKGFEFEANAVRASPTSSLELQLFRLVKVY